MVNELLVFIGGRLAGVARRWPGSETQRIAFRYDDAYRADPESTPLSLRLPIRDDEYEIGTWLDGLLHRQGIRPQGVGPNSRRRRRPSRWRCWPPLLGSTALGRCSSADTSEEGAIYDRDSGMEWHTADEIADWARKAKQGAATAVGQSPPPQSRWVAN